MRTLGINVLFLIVATLTCSATAELKKAEGDTVSVETTNHILKGTICGKPAVEYRFSQVPFKPYVQVFATPNGVNVLRDSPEDHKHHHALMFAVKVDGVNFWEEFPERKPGTQVHRKFASDATATCCNGVCSFDLGQEQLDWNTSDGRTLLKEVRRIVVSRDLDAPAEGTVLTWTGRFELPSGKSEAVLTGSHYHGLGIRFPASMDNVGTHFNAVGKKGSVYRGSERLAETKWTAYTAPVDGKPVTVAVFDHPDNPRPAVMFTMVHGFAYISATLDLEKRPLKIQAGKPLELRYGVVAWDGKKSADDVEKAYQEWVTQASRK